MRYSFKERRLKPPFMVPSFPFQIFFPPFLTTKPLIKIKKTKIEIRKEQRNWSRLPFKGGRTSPVDRQIPPRVWSPIQWFFDLQVESDVLVLNLGIGLGGHFIGLRALRPKLLWENNGHVSAKIFCMLPVHSKFSTASTFNSINTENLVFNL